MADLPILIKPGVRANLLQTILIPSIQATALDIIRDSIRHSRAITYRETTKAIDSRNESERIRIFLSVAEAMELLGRSISRDQDPENLLGKFLDYSLASLAYECGESPANAKLLAIEAENVWGKIVNGYKPDNPIHFVENRVLACALAMMKKEYLEALSIAEEVISRIPELEETCLELYQEERYSRSDLEHFVGMTLIIRGCLQVIMRLIRPEVEESYDIDYFDDASQIYEYLGNSVYWLLAKLLSSSSKKVLDAGSIRQLKKYFRGHPEINYLTSLLSPQRKIFHFWPSQLYAIQQGVLDPKIERIALSLPTSSGKTLIAEIAIAKELLRDPEARCIYLASTRALVSEVEWTLRRSLKPLGIKVSQISQTAELSPVDAEIAIDNRLLCLTPEKLDALLRLGHEILGSIRLIIIDEGQLLEDIDRGQLLEYAIIKLQLRFPSTKMLFLSAVVPNADEIAAWLGSQEHQSRPIVSDWRPTRLKVGEAKLENLSTQDIEMNQLLSAANALGNRLIKRCTVRYTDGEQLDAFYVRYGQAREYNTYEKQTMALAKSYANRGSVLLLSTSKPRVETLAALLAEKEELSNDDALRKLAIKIQREVDPDFPLASQVKRGIAYHHGDLPPRIRYQIERIARQNKFKYITATTTLAEGVNLPVSTIIVDDLRFRYQVEDTWRSEMMSARKFWNLAGRAGRANVDTEGHIIILDADRFFDTNESKAAFLNPDLSALEPVESVFLQIIRLLEGNYHELLSFEFQTDPFEKISAIQNFLLSLLDLEDVFGYERDPDIAIEKIIKHSLISYQKDASESHRRHFRNFVRWGFGIINQYRMLPFEQKRLIVKMGFSIKSALSLLDKLSSLQTGQLLRLLSIRDENGLSAEILTELYSLAFDIPEILPRRHSEASHADIAMNWISGRTIGEISRRFFHHVDRSLSEASNYLYSTQALNGYLAK